MTRVRFLALALLLSVLASRAGAEFPKDGDPDFYPKLKTAIASIKPLPETPIPDDPPPHEGAWFDLPYIVEPPDLLLVEVLEALPGRPITGERLVRPDGSITLGFYGDVYVRGLTIEQVKVKIVEHLRRHLPDTVLGVLEESNDPGPIAPKLKPPPGENPFEIAPPPLENKGEAPAKPKTSAIGPGRTTKRGWARRIIRRTGDDSSKYEPAQPSSPTVAIPAGSNITIRIEIQGVKPPEPIEEKLAPPASEPSAMREVAPEDTNRVFVDVVAYNSKRYYVTGDVAKPGSFPITGHDTVQDALNYAAGFIPSADQENIQLVRPARGGKPEKIYKIDYRGIVEKGDKRLNYQLFPGDRLVVGRNRMIQNTIMIDRLAASLQTLVNSSLQASSMYRGLVAATPDLTPAQRETMLKEWFELVWKASSQPGGPMPDARTMQEMLLRQFKTQPKAESGPEKK